MGAVLYGRKALLAAGLALFMGIAAGARVLAAGAAGMTGLLDIVLYGAIAEPRMDVFMAIFLCLLPYMVLVFPLLDYVADDLQICAVYMFTRYDRRAKWYFSKLGKLASLTFLSGAVYFGSIMVLPTAYGLPVTDNWQETLLRLANSFVFMLTLAMAANVFSLIFPSHYTMLGIVGILLLGIVFSTVREWNASAFYFLNMVNLYFVDWREPPSAPANIAVFLGIILGLAAAGLGIVKTMDISVRDKDFQ